MLRPLTYEEYHEKYSDHLMRDYDIPPTCRIVEVEYYDREVKWFECEESFDIHELNEYKGTIRLVTIS